MKCFQYARLVGKVGPPLAHPGNAVRTRRGLIRVTALLLAILLAVAVAAAVRLYQAQLPDPSSADRAELLRWLVTRDLNEESPQTRWILAYRLDEEFHEGVDWEQVGGQLNAERRARLWKNVPLLLEPWFMEKVDGYFKQPPPERLAYVDEMIDTVTIWNGLDAIRPDVAEDNPRGAPRPSLTDMLLAEVEGWQHRAAPEQRERIEQFVLAVQTRWLVRRLTDDLASPR